MLIVTTLLVAFANGIIVFPSEISLRIFQFMSYEDLTVYNIASNRQDRILEAIFGFEIKCDFDPKITWPVMTLNDSIHRQSGECISHIKSFAFVYSKIIIKSSKRSVIEPIASIISIIPSHVDLIIYLIAYGRNSLENVLHSLGNRRTTIKLVDSLFNPAFSSLIGNAISDPNMDILGLDISHPRFPSDNQDVAIESSLNNIFRQLNNSKLKAFGLICNERSSQTMLLDGNLKCLTSKGDVFSDHIKQSKITEAKFIGCHFHTYIWQKSLPRSLKYLAIGSLNSNFIENIYLSDGLTLISLMLYHFSEISENSVDALAKEITLGRLQELMAPKYSHSIRLLPKSGLRLENAIRSKTARLRYFSLHIRVRLPDSDWENYSELDLSFYCTIVKTVNHIVIPPLLTKNPKFKRGIINCLDDPKNMVRSLDLGGCYFSDDGAILLAGILKNTKIGKINLVNNMIYKAGADALSNAALSGNILGKVIEINLSWNPYTTYDPNSNNVCCIL